MKYPLLLIAGAFALVGAGCAKPAAPQVACCTMEAKICPDGSSVGRQGPLCEFAACPELPVAPVATSTVFSKDDLIQVDASIASTTLASPLMVTGRARGPWYFEASFPVELRDGMGAMLASGVAQAQGEWMTMDYVPFSLSLNFGMPTTATGTLILKKDNPSGEPANDSQLIIPVQF